MSDYKGFNDANRFNIAYICLTKNAGAWFESLKARHARAGKSGSFTANTGYASRKEFLVKVGPTGELLRNNVLIWTLIGVEVKDESTQINLTGSSSGSSTQQEICSSSDKMKGTQQ